MTVDRQPGHAWRREGEVRALQGRAARCAGWTHDGPALRALAATLGV
jgi:hypothetical protein